MGSFYQRYFAVDSSFRRLGLGYRNRTVASLALGAHLNSDLQRASCRARRPGNPCISSHARRGRFRLDAPLLKNYRYIAIAYSNCNRTAMAVLLLSK